MNLALLSFEYPPETGFGGIGTYTWYQARALVKLGHRVDVIAGANEGTPLRTSEHDGVRVYRFRSTGFVMDRIQKLDSFRMWWTRNRLENSYNMYCALRTISRENKYDLVEMPECGAEGLLINHFTSVNSIVRFHSPSRLIMPLYDVRKSDIFCCSLLERLAIGGAVSYTACSRFLAAETHTKLKIRKPVQVIPNGIDLQLFDQEERIDIRQKFDLPPTRPIILYCGRMEQRKGIHLCKEIVESILKRYEVSFVFVGQDLFNYLGGTLIPYWEKIPLRGSIHYLGMQPPHVVRSCLRQSDIFLFPSIWENCPYACLEAMAAGCAIVSSNQGGMPELIQDQGNGLLAQSGSPLSYVAGLEQLLENPGLQKRLGDAARRTIELHYQDIDIARQSVDFYGDCLNQNFHRDKQSHDEEMKEVSETKGVAEDLSRIKGTRPE